MVTHNRLKELLEYSPETGEFTWRIQKRRAYAGTRAGSLTDSGYRLIGIDGTQYRAHRLAFLYINGEFPAEFVDHIDGHKDNNRWGNLRLASKQENGFNVGLKVGNTSGVKGVSFRKDRNKYRAYLRINGKIKHLGFFDDLEFAELVVNEARSKFHGEFANYGS